MKVNKSILLLEDDAVDIMILKRAFKKLEIENQLEICNNGEEGLTWLQDHKDSLPGLIILDLNMPKMNGLEFLEQIKESSLYRKIPVIVLTTSKAHEDRTKAFDKSIAGYMVKPVDYNDFINIVDQIKNYWRISEIAY